MHDDYQRRIAAGQTWVMEREGAIVGLLVLENLPAALLLDNVAVAPAEQGKGYGRRLIAFAEQEARRRGYGEVRLYTHVLMTENIARYRHLGFTELGLLREKEFARVFMAKRLDDRDTTAWEHRARATPLEQSSPRSIQRGNHDAPLRPGEWN